MMKLSPKPNMVRPRAPDFPLYQIRSSRVASDVQIITTTNGDQSLLGNLHQSSTAAPTIVSSFPSTHIYQPLHVLRLYSEHEVPTHTLSAALDHLMPRPAAKRNRLASRTLGASNHTQSHQTRSDVLSREISRSPRSDAVGSGLANSADTSDIIRKLRNQTPLSKAHEFAIGSSPGTEQGATGSRPPTRARGYSSTLSIAGRKGDTSSRVPGTPAFENSILSNFRRRPRQASILHMMQDEDGSSDLDDDDFLGGLSPEDESTPLNISRGKSLVLRPAVSSPDKSPSLPSSGKSSKRKRSAERTDAESPLDLASSTPGTPTPNLETRRSEAYVELPCPSESPAAFSETMVPPMSSPVPILMHEMSTIEADRLQSRPNKARNLKAAQPKDNKLQLPTAALQDQLLPRRRLGRARRQGTSRFEVLSESEDEDLSSVAADDDELSFLPMRKRSQARLLPTGTKPLPSGRANLHSNPRGKDGKTVKRYGASTHEETNGSKENEPTEVSSPLSSALDTDELDSEFDMEQGAPAKAYLSEELRLQALKFAEVDKWQMEFEDVITVGTQENGAFR
ncbi:hypothetical protein BDW75DRAFT_152534 [Aspergillus navahoensis]